MRMVIITIIKSIKIHYSIYFVLFFSIVIGLYQEFFIVLFSFLFHELGHLLFLYIFKYKINKITIYPFGGVIDFNNKPDFLYRYFLISIGGLLFNFLLIVFGYLFDLKLLVNINILFVILNLIPIYPLDGSKILLSFLKMFFPYHFCKKIIYYLSIIFSFCVFVFILRIYRAYILFLFLFLFVSINYLAIKSYSLEYNNFLLQRHLYPNKSLKNKVVKFFENPVLFLFYGKNMIFDFEEFMLCEEDVLNKYFKNKK